MKVYVIGQTVVVSDTIINSTTGLPATPTALELRVLDPSMTETDTPIGSLVNPSVGVYTFQIVVRISGIWRYRFAATSPFYTAGEKTFRVLPSPFLIGPTSNPP